MSDIRTEIRLAIIECEVLYGRPTKIYLGREQIKKLKMLPIDIGMASIDMRGGNRMTYQGYKVYRVDSDDHCFVA